MRIQSLGVKIAGSVAFELEWLILVGDERGGNLAHPLLFSEQYPDGYRPARPGFLHHKRDAKRPRPHNIPSIVESQASAKVGVAHLRRRAGWHRRMLQLPSTLYIITHA